MPNKLLNKFTTCLSVSLVLILSLVASLTLTHPQIAHAATLPAYRYTKTFDTSAGSAEGKSVATDAQGNVYVTGRFHGTVTFDGTGGSDSQDAGSIGDAFLTKYNANGTYAFTKTFDTSASGAFANAASVATDPQGNVYITGYFNGTVTFDGTGGSDTQTDAGGNGDSFLTKYNANGSYAFTKTFDDSVGGSYAAGDGVATDPQGNVYITGYFNGTVTFDGTGGSDSRTVSNEDTFLTKYNANGTYAFTKIFDTSAATFADGNVITTDAQGNVYVTGLFIGTVVFDGPGGSDSQTAGGGNTDSFLTKYNANGSYGYTKTFDTSASGTTAQSAGLATDPQGNIYVAGDFDGTVVFDGTGGSDSQTSSNFNSFLTKYNANGSYAFTKTFDTASLSYAQGGAVATDDQGNIYLAGYFSGTVIFDGTGGSDSQTSSNDSSFLTRYNADGSYAYTKSFDTTGGGLGLASANATGVATDAQGNVYMAGRFFGTVTFDGTSGSDSQTAGGGNTDAFLTSFQVFTPGQASSPAASAASASVPGAPNTGFGVVSANPTRTFLLYSLASIGLLGLAKAARKFSKQ